MTSFLTSEQEAELVQAIARAEMKTSGEIRVHLEQIPCNNALQRAQEVFFLLNMEKTQHQNGILFYVNTTSKQFALIGDEGIHKKVTELFWESTKNEVIFHFKKGEFYNGLLKGIKKVGEQLQYFFPYLPNDVNELPNEISKGDL